MKLMIQDTVIAHQGQRLYFLRFEITLPLSRMSLPLMMFQLIDLMIDSLMHLQKLLQ